jgi:excisionase family DNA binding protein
VTDRDIGALAKRLATLIGTANREPFYTPQTLARRLSLSERTVREMLARGVIPSYKVEGARRIDPRDVERYLVRCKEDHVA